MPFRVAPRHGDEEGDYTVADIQSLNIITEKIIGAAIEVHRQLGPGLLESIYESALCVELDLQGIKYMRQVVLPILYKNHSLGDYRIDLLVENEIIIELKAVEQLLPVHEAQLLTI